MFVEVPVTTEVLGPPETGEWCEQCLLPSAIRVWFLVSVGASTSLWESVFCPECQWHDHEPPPRDRV